MPRALIVYATSEGQTRKIAHRLAEVMRSEGYDVDMVEGPEPNVSPEPYDAVLLGGSVHVGSFQRSVVEWARRWREVLGPKHDGFFGVCMAAASDTPAKREEAQGYFDELLRQTDWQPDRAVMFAGSLAFTQYGFLKRWLMAAIARSSETPFEDTRHDYEFTDWASVEDFARAFAHELDDRPAERGTGSDAA